MANQEMQLYGRTHGAMARHVIGRSPAHCLLCVCAITLCAFTLCVPAVCVCNYSLSNYCVCAFGDLRKRYALVLSYSMTAHTTGKGEIASAAVSDRLSSGSDSR